MSILARIRANGGDVVRDQWRFTLRRGRLTVEALAWLKAGGRWHQACAEAWSILYEWEERAAIMEFGFGLPRPEAERLAYADVGAC